MRTGRISSCIEGLDSLIEGGFPEKTAILLSGRPGSGKTTFGAQYIHQGAENGEKGIFCLVGQDAEQFREDMSCYGFDFGKLEKKGLVKVISLPEHEKEFDEALANLVGMVGDFRPKRIVIDSFSVWFGGIQKEFRRKELISSLRHLVKQSTLLMTMEHMGGGNIAYPDEFASDAVVLLDLVESDEGLHRKLKILKMRRTHHTKEFFDYKITDKGLKILARPVLEHPSEVSRERIGTGVKGLDSAIGGGFYRGSSSLVCGHTGAGKTILGLQFLMEGVRRREKSLLLSLDESTGQIIREADSLGWDFRAFTKSEKLSIISVYPETLSPDEFLLQVLDYIEKNGIRRIMLDSVSRLEKAFNEEEARTFAKRLNAFCKCNGITLMFTYETVQAMDHLPSEALHVSSLVDSIIMLKQVELLGELKRSLTIIKHRGSDHDKKIKEFEISKGGIVLMGDLRHVESAMPGFVGGFP